MTLYTMLPIRQTLTPEGYLETSKQRPQFAFVTVVIRP